MKEIKSITQVIKKSNTLNAVGRFLKKSAKRGFAIIIGGFVGVLVSMVFASFSGVKAQSNNTVFVQPSVSFPNGNPDLYIDTGSEVTNLHGQLKVNPSPTTIPSGLSDRQVVSDYSGTFIGSLGVFVQSFVDEWNANLGVRDKFWVDHEDDGTFLSPTGGTKAVSLSKIGVPIFPIAPASTIDMHPTLTHAYVAHGETGKEKKLCADALGYIQLCDEPVPTTHEGYTCGNGSLPSNGTWYGPSTAIAHETLCTSGVTYGSTDTNAINCKIVYPNQAPPSGTLCVNTKCNAIVGNGLPVGTTCENGISQNTNQSG